MSRCCPPTYRHSPKRNAKSLNRKYTERTKRRDAALAECLLLEERRLLSWGFNNSDTLNGPLWMTNDTNGYNQYSYADKTASPNCCGAGGPKPNPSGSDTCGSCGGSGNDTGTGGSCCGGGSTYQGAYSLSFGAQSPVAASRYPVRYKDGLPVVQATDLFSGGYTPWGIT